MVKHAPLSWAEGGCSCGSGKPREPLHDARGIFAGYVCDECRAEKMRGFRPEVFRDSQYEADDLGDDTDLGGGEDDRGGFP